MYLLGIDPGLATTGFGVLHVAGHGKPEIVQFGVISTPAKTPLGDRLMTIRDDLAELIDQYKPSHVGMEEVFFSKNVTTAINVSHARGVITELCTRKGLHIAEFNPMKVKQFMTGNGRADKKQIQQILKMEFGLTFMAKHDDAADAVAIALCLLHQLRAPA